MAGLRRDLGFVETAALAASMMLGTGIFFGPSLTAKEFPSGPIVLLLWGIGGAVALAGAWVFGRLGSMFPYSGGPYVYVREAYGPFAGFMFAWTSFVVIAPTSMAVLAKLFAQHLGDVWPLNATGLGLVAVWSLAAATFANVIGVKMGGRVQALLTGLKIVLVAGLIVILLSGAGHAAPSASVQGGGRLGVAFVGILFAVGGWEYAVLASEEVRDPRRTIPRALVAGTAIVVVLYLLLIGSLLLVVGPGGAAVANALAPEAAEQALPGSSAFVAIAVAISALGTLNAIVLLGPRATFALARDGLLPGPVARLSNRWGTPVVAILLQAVLASVFEVAGHFETVAGFTVVGTGIFIVLSAVALPRLRRRAEAAARARFRPEDAAALLVAAVYGWFIGTLLVDSTGPALLVLGVILAGIVPYIILRRLRTRRPPPAVPSAEEPVP